MAEESRRSETTSTRGYLEQTTQEETDTRDLISSSDSDSSDDGRHAPRTKRQPQIKPPSKWWFQHKQVRDNCIVVLGAWFLICLSICCFVVGIVLEIIYHTGSEDLFRGFILMIIGVVIFTPSGYAVTHVYLAAKRIGRIRMKSVWFFK